MEGKDVILFITFIMIFVGFINYMPSGIYVHSYTGSDIDIPSEFDAWKILPRDYFVEDFVNKSLATIYDFTPYFNTTQKFRVKWFNYNDEIMVSGLTSQFLNIGLFRYDLLPIINLEMLEVNFDSETNYSTVVCKDYQRTVECYFEDTNDTRNNITQAWLEGAMNCTMSVPTQYKKSEYIGARDIVMALLTFRIPSVFGNIHPLVGFVISLIFYIPLAFSAFWVIVWLLHGG